MLVYRLDMAYERENQMMDESVETHEAEQETCKEENEQDKLCQTLISLNKTLGRGCVRRGRALFACRMEDERIGMVLASKKAVASAEEIEELLQDYLIHHLPDIRNVHMEEFREITCAEFCSQLMQGDLAGLLQFSSTILSDLSMDYFDSKRIRGASGYQLEECMAPAMPKTKAAVLRHAEKIMPHTSLKEELGRICHARNSKTFMGHPVHYIVHAESWQAAKEIIGLLVSTLHSHHRLESKRIHYFSELRPGCLKDRDWKSSLSLSKHATAVFSLANQSAEKANLLYAPREREEDLIKALSAEMELSGEDTLFILAVIGHTNRETMGHLISAVEEELDFVRLYEGMGEAEQARVYVNHISQNHNHRAFTDEELAWALPEGKSCSLTTAWDAYQKLSKHVLRFEHYPAYRTLKAKAQPTETEECENSSYEKLQQLVGLEEIKQLVDRILAMHRMQALRKDMGITAEQNAMHMVFTGNPGSAKTTVARLLAGILKERRILPTGAFVECGRGDLVGKYVGSTAPIVKRKFAEAMGGVLFIDEAYSLLDDKRGLFGDEAINTIVQEMENHRGELLVIFAGYPEPMKSFLERNEGLRSRVAFHLDFPDYNAEELCDILQVMAKEKGYRVEVEALRHCRRIFPKACSTADFGNGRYVRNLLESAILCQAERLMNASPDGKITKQMAESLILSDFRESSTVLDASMEKRSIGFCKSA